MENQTGQDASSSQQSDGGEKPSRPGAKSHESQWKEDMWAKSIIEYMPIQNSKKKLEQRLSTFLAQATPTEIEEFEKTREMLFDALETAKSAKAARYPEYDKGEAPMSVKFKHACSKASGVAFQYTQMLDVVVGQAPEYVSAAYGAIKIILVAQVNHEETKQKIQKYLEQITAKFEIVGHITAYMPTAQLVAALGRAYDLFTVFLSKAVKFYTQARLKAYFKALIKPWDRLQEIVSALLQTLLDVKDIAQFNGLAATYANLTINKNTLDVTERNEKSIINTQAVVETLLARVEAIALQLSKKSDIEETSSFVQQEVEERLDDPIRDPNSYFPAAKDANIDPPSSTGPETTLENLRNELFTALREQASSSSKRKKALEELPGMRAHRSKQRNILKAEKFLDFIDSETSQLLWVDGNSVLSRPEFNVSFALPLLLIGESMCESLLVLRHSCGEVGDTQKHHALIQALLLQAFEQDGTLLETKCPLITKENSSNIGKLWDIFKACLEETEAQCIFIIVDNFDNLDDFGTAHVSYAGDRHLILQHLEGMIKQKDKLIKIMLTTRLANHVTTMHQGYSALVRQPSIRNQERSLSIASLDDQAPLVAHRVLELRDKTDISIAFADLPLLYVPGSLVYSNLSDSPQAFVVAELSGMSPRPFGYDPLHLRAWSVDHNGRYFTKRFHEFIIPSFIGRRPVSGLKYIPAGHVRGENSIRKSLIERGRKYWEFASGMCQMELSQKSNRIRIIIDQRRRPQEPRPSQEYDDQFPVVNSDMVKPRTLILCPPEIDIYLIPDLRWTRCTIDEICEVEWDYNPFALLVLPENQKNVLLSLAYSTEEVEVPSRASLEKLERDSMPGTIPNRKGEGQIVLLHGPPGTGKTLTAEAVAEMARRPLLRISMADLGHEPVDVGRNLLEFLTNAINWGAIALLEDADAYVEQRQANDMRHSTIISMFLRAIDSFQGILFLTTNRVGGFDKAVMSHISLGIYYESLNDEERQQVWTALFTSLDNMRLNGGLEIHYDANAEAYVRMSEEVRLLRWNGREIRNAFKTAMTLAIADSKAQKQKNLEDVVPRITEAHLKGVVRLSATFNEEMQRRVRQP